MLYTYVPVSLARSIIQSYTDKNISNITGVYTISPGGYPYFLILLGAPFSL